MYQAHAKTIERTLKDAKQSVGTRELADDMFQRFFQRFPETERFFAGFNMEELKTTKVWILTDFLTNTLLYPDFANNWAHEELDRHKIHDIRDIEYYYGIADALYDSVRAALAKTWDTQTELHWQESLTHMKHLLSEAAKKELAI